MKKYKAIKKGFDGVVIREVGDVFEFEGKPGSWMVLLDEKPGVEVKPKDEPKKPVKPSNDRNVI